MLGWWYLWHGLGESRAFLTHWGLTLELTALSAPVVSGGWTDVLGRPNHSFPDASYYAF